VTDLVLLALSWTFVVSGGFFVVVGAIGIYRFPDFYSRLHGAGVTDTFGADLLVIGLIFQAFLTIPEWDAAAFIAVKLAFIVAFIFLTSPTATHAIANAAHVAGLKPYLNPLSALEVAQKAEGEN
jgi:multicomponent Na+:H+ antiporter subunit G